MKTFKIEDGDILFDGQNNIAMTYGKNEEVQSIERVLTTNLNEWFLNAEHGFDYSVVQTKQVDEEGIRLEIIRAISQDPRVQEVEEINLQFERQNRKLNINFKVKMQDGTINEGQVVV
jgi:hypothetical protein